MNAPVVILAALGEEAAALQRVVAPLHVPVLPTGVGKVAAAMHTQRAIDAHQPAALLFVGVAGGLKEDLEPLSVIVARDAVQWDVDLTRINRTAPGTLNDGRRYLELDAVGTTLALDAARELGLPARLGRVATADTFLADPDRAAWIRDTFDADAVDMEGAACVQVAADNGVPVVLLRAISDGAGTDAGMSFEAFLHAASDRAAAIVERFLPAWLTALGAPDTPGR